MKQKKKKELIYTMTNVEKFKQMDARQIAEALHMISRCHIEDGSVFCGNCFIGALCCDVE